VSDELDDAERTRLMLKAQAQRLEELVANLEAELEEDENPATRRRLNVAAEKLAAVNAELAPLMARRTNQLFEDFQRAVNGTLEEQLPRPKCLRFLRVVIPPKSGGCSPCRGRPTRSSSGC
jgi:F0F1-type ATP synthase membrane subunit b/b'